MKQSTITFRTLFIPVILILAVFFQSACTKKTSKEEGLIPEVVNGKKVTIRGRVKGGGGYSEKGVTISINGKLLTSDTEGNYEFSDVVSDPDKVHMKFSRPGYWDYHKMLVVEEEGIYNGIDVQLNSIYDTRSFEAVTGGELKFAGLRFNFPASAVQKADGSEFKGAVYVDALDLDRDAPGDMRADYGRSKVILESYGAFVLKLKSQNNEELKLSKEVTVTYSRALGASNFPLKLQLWLFNEDKAIWSEAGLAARVSSDYSAIISKSGFYSIAVAHPCGLLRTKIKDSKTGNVGNELQIFSSCNEYNFVSSFRCISNSNGVALQYVPAEIKLRTFFRTKCLDYIIAQEYNISSQNNNNAEKTVVTDLSKYLTDMSGMVEDCDYKPVNGSAEIEVAGRKYSSDIINGKYRFKVLTCGNEFATLRIYDHNKKLVYTKEAYDFVQGKIYKSSDVKVCDRPQQGTVSVIADGITYTFQTPQDSIKYFTVYEKIFQRPVYGIYVSSRDMKKSFYITNLNPSVEVSPIYTLALGIPGHVYQMGLIDYSPGTMTISSYKSAATIIQGTFKTKTHHNYDLYTNQRDIREIQGSFKITQ